MIYNPSNRHIRTFFKVILFPVWPSLSTLGLLSCLLMNYRHLLLIAPLVLTACGNSENAPPQNLTVEIKKIAYITEVDVQNNLLTYDPVDWLTGDDAIVAATEDTKCTAERIEECMPSLEKNYYIRNAEQKTEAGLMSQQPVISMITELPQSGGNENSLSTLDSIDFKSAPWNDMPFEIVFENGSIKRVSELFRP
jgi:hypothetical protein